MGKTTELDRVIGHRIKQLRSDAGLTQPKVAEYLGIAYQSYQKMEAGRVSFRASTLDRLALLYNVKLSSLVTPTADTIVDPVLVKVVAVIGSMKEADKETLLRAVLNFKHRGQLLP